MDRSAENHTGGSYEPPVQGAPSPGGTEVKKERETKDDGRYIIFYTFEDEYEQESRGS